MVGAVAPSPTSSSPGSGTITACPFARPRSSFGDKMSITQCSARSPVHLSRQNQSGASPVKLRSPMSPSTCFDRS